MTSVESTPRAAEFLAAAGDFLRTRPIEHSVLLTNAAGRVEDATADDLWAWVRAGDELLAAAMHTPPFGAQVAVGSDDAMRELAAYFHRSQRDLPSVGGLRPQAEAFAEEWVRRTGVEADVAMRQGMYAANAVIPPAGVDGRLRRATADELDLLGDWVTAFHADTEVPVEPANDLALRVAAGRLWLWVVDDSPVSMAGNTVAVGGVSRVQYVYTPPEHRGHGYASACVAALTVRELANPGRTCMLYTDLANPTSNGIYQAVGYRRVGEAVQLSFA